MAEPQPEADDKAQRIAANIVLGFLALSDLAQIMLIILGADAGWGVMVLAGLYLWLWPLFVLAAILGLMMVVAALRGKTEGAPAFLLFGGAAVAIPVFVYLRFVALAPR